MPSCGFKSRSRDSAPSIPHLPRYTSTFSHSRASRCFRCNHLCRSLNRNLLSQTSQVDPVHQSPQTRGTGFSLKGNVSFLPHLTHLVSFLFLNISAGFAFPEPLWSADRSVHGGISSTLPGTLFFSAGRTTDKSIARHFACAYRVRLPMPTGGLCQFYLRSRVVLLYVPVRQSPWLRWVNEERPSSQSADSDFATPWPDRFQILGFPHRCGPVLSPHALPGFHPYGWTPCHPEYSKRFGF